MDKVTLDFENETVEWDTDTSRGTESCPWLSGRKGDVLAAMGYGTWDASGALGAVNALISGETAGSRLSDIFEPESRGDKQPVTLDMVDVKEVNVLRAAKETYCNYGDEAYAQSKVASFIKRCGAGLRRGPEHPISMADVASAVFGALDNDSEKLFWQNLYRKEGFYGF